MKSVELGAIFTGLLIVCLWFVAIFGWGLNIYKLTQCNFEPSYRTEAIRTIGVFVAPVGAITGYMEIQDKEKK